MQSIKTASTRVHYKLRPYRDLQSNSSASTPDLNRRLRFVDNYFQYLHWWSGLVPYQKECWCLLLSHAQTAELKKTANDCCCHTRKLQKLAENEGNRHRLPLAITEQESGIPTMIPLGSENRVYSIGSLSIIKHISRWANSKVNSKVRGPLVHTPLKLQA